MGNNLNDYSKRIRYLSYNGEALIYTGLILIGGAFLTYLTLQLFSSINAYIDEWYIHWVAVIGAVASPIVGTYVSNNRLVLSGKIAPLMAKIFSPLVLVTLAIFLTTAASQGGNPFTDRHSLIVFNCMLLAVLAIATFVIAERPSDGQKISLDYINTALLAVALIVNIIALAAILFRLSSYGFTPNRVAVLGSNIIIFLHLILISWSYLGFLRCESLAESIHRRIAGYLPVYAVWSVIVTFAFPVIFAFK